MEERRVSSKNCITVIKIKQLKLTFSVFNSLWDTKNVFKTTFYVTFPGRFERFEPHLNIIIIYPKMLLGHATLPRLFRRERLPRVPIATLVQNWVIQIWLPRQSCTVEEKGKKEVFSL